MTNYNDGNWHGWNGGEYPVHRETEVEVIRFNGARHKGLACSFDWQDRGHLSSIVAFRVIREHRVPREWWTIYAGAIFDTKEAAQRYAKHLVTSGEGPEVIHVREVLDK